MISFIINYYNTSERQGNEINDKVFLLSYSEVNIYFKKDHDCQCETREKHNDNKSNFCYWWLHSIGASQEQACVIYPNGSDFCFRVNADNVYVRPAMWIDLNS